MYSLSIVVLILGAFLASTKADQTPCMSQCEKSFNNSKNQDACKKGCDGFEASKTFAKLNDQNDIDEIMNNCRHSCQDAFTVEKDSEIKSSLIHACNKGCDIASNPLPSENLKTGVMKPTQQSKPRSIFDIMFGDDIFSGLEPNDSHRGGGLTISFGVPRMMKIDEERMLNRADPMGLPSWIPNHMKQMMSRMHSSMNQMLDNLKEDMPNMLGKSTSGGKLVMINSGPGYHEEKTYNIGPDGEMKLLKKDETHSMNDMMERRNPLDDQVQPRDVETFDPLWQRKIDESLAKQGHNNKIWENLNGWPNIAEMGQAIKEKEREREIMIKPILKEIDESIAKHTIYGNEPWDGPKLPEHGLRSRDHHMCHMDNKLIKWSDWVSCLHMRLGMPRWVMTATLCIGIIFLLWLCLVIPNNAPKQRVKKNINTKEAEATLAVVTVDTKNNYAKDLPPAYEEVANLSVQLEPVHKELVKKPEASLEQPKEASA